MIKALVIMEMMSIVITILYVITRLINLKRNNVHFDFEEDEENK